MKTITEALAELKVDRPDGKRYIENWQKHIPSWSMWTPGSLGQADCPACKGLGVVRVDVSLKHPFFGKLFACECQDGPALRPALANAVADEEASAKKEREQRRAESITRARKDLD